MHKYLPHTKEDIGHMLHTTGVPSLDDLFAEIPEEIRLKGGYDLPPAQSELEIRQTFDRLCNANTPLTVFAGAGAFQSMMAELTGMDISNASMYDGSTATAEAVLMAANNSKKTKRVIISPTIDPKTASVVRTYAHFHGIDIETCGCTDGITDKSDLERRLSEGPVAGVVVQQPNRYGIVEDFSGIADAVHASKGLFIINSVPFDLAVLRTPGE